MIKKFLKNLKNLKNEMYNQVVVIRTNLVLKIANDVFNFKFLEKSYLSICVKFREIHQYMNASV